MLLSAYPEGIRAHALRHQSNKNKGDNETEYVINGSTLV